MPASSETRVRREGFSNSMSSVLLWRALWYASGLAFIFMARLRMEAISGRDRSLILATWRDGCDRLVAAIDGVADTMALSVATTAGFDRSLESTYPTPLSR